MDSPTLSNAQSLRLIGDHLRGLSIDAFELDKVGDEYVVRVDENQPNGKPSTGTGFSLVKIDLAQEKMATHLLLHFNRTEILRLQLQGRLRRAEPGGMPDPSSLGLKMRVLGQFLDLKGVDEFTLSWSADSAKVNFLQREQRFSPSNLYDFGICMYLKRSDDDSQAEIFDRIAV
jgi:hypothetical protein